MCWKKILYRIQAHEEKRSRAMVDEGFNNYYDVIRQVEKELRQKGEISFTRIDEITKPQDVRASSVIDELSMSDTIKADYKAAKLVVKK
jgi:hypothetical protein